MIEREIVEMAKILLEMHTDAYLKCKYILLAASAEHQGTNDFMKLLFSLIDNKRPMLIEMKVGDAVC